MMRTALLVLAALVVAFTSACATSSRSETVKAAPLSAAEIATMTLSQRAVLIEQYDPISRVEVLLGQPLFISTFPRNRPFPTFQFRYYRLTKDVVLSVSYNPATELIFYYQHYAVKDGFSDLVEHNNAIAVIKKSKREAVANGYADWIVSSEPSTVQRGLYESDHDAIFAFEKMDSLEGADGLP